MDVKQQTNKEEVYFIQHLEIVLPVFKAGLRCSIGLGWIIISSLKGKSLWEIFSISMILNSNALGNIMSDWINFKTL